MIWYLACTEEEKSGDTNDLEDKDGGVRKV